MKIYVLIGIWHGCLNDVTAYMDVVQARMARDELLKEYDLTDEDKPDNAHSEECRWNDENEVHLHEVELTTEAQAILSTKYAWFDCFPSCQI